MSKLILSVGPLFLIFPCLFFVIYSFVYFFGNIVQQARKKDKFISDKRYFKTAVFCIAIPLASYVMMEMVR